MVGKGFKYQLVEGCIKVFSLLQNVGKLTQLLCHNGVQSNIGARNGLGRAQHTELKLIASEGHGGGAVTVGGILGDGGQHIHANAHDALLRVGIVGAVNDRIHNGSQLVTQENGDDGRRCFVGTQAVVIACKGNGAAQPILILVDALDKGRQEHQELSVLPGGLAGLEKILAGIGAQRPVVMLAGAVDTGKGLFVEEAHKVVLGSNLFHYLHGQLVGVTGVAGIGENGSQLMLTGSALVVLGLGQDTKTPKLLIQVLHEVADPGADGSEIMVIQLLSLRGQCAKEGTAGQPQVLPLIVNGPGNEEILLLRAYADLNALGGVVTKQPQDTHSLPGNLVQRAKQGRLFIQSFSGVGEETGRDVQAIVPNKGKSGRVPRSIAPGLKDGSQTAGGKAGGIGFATDQLFAGKLHNHSAVAGGGDEGIVLFRSKTGHGLEPMGIVGSTLFDGPLLHSLRDLVGHIQRQGASGADALLPGVIDFRSQALLHGGLAKYIRAKNIRYIQVVTHRKASFPCCSSLAKAILLHDMLHSKRK